jgi:hypothetical protein
MSTKSLAIMTFVAGVGVGVVLILVATSLPFDPPRERLTLTSLSPDERLRVNLVEAPGNFIDRNFDLRLEQVDGRATKTLFRSPDEGRPEGSERIVWAADSSRFVLVGRHFDAGDAPRLSTAETLYLMCEVATGRLWCNSRQQQQFPPFSLQDLEGVEWEQSLAPGPVRGPTSQLTGK